MTSFINAPHPDHHHGADRMEALMDAVQQGPRNLWGKHGAALLVGSALAAAVAAVSYEIMDSATESHLLMVWMVLWIALFAVLAFSAGALRSAGQRLRSSLDDWSRSIAEARADQRLWTIAQQDSRVMADLQSALARSDALDDVHAGSTPVVQAPHARRAAVSRSRPVQRAH